MASVDDDGKLTYRDWERGSNFGVGVEFAAPAENITLPAMFTPDPQDTVASDWGGTSYAAPQVAGLIARMLNYLPFGSKAYPSFLKNLIVRFGDHSEHLEGKLKNPIVINPARTLDHLKNTFYFRYRQKKQYIELLCDKRLMSIQVGKFRKDRCHQKNQWLRLPRNIGDVVKINAVYFPQYSLTPNVSCELSVRARNSEGLFPFDEGLMECK